MRLFFDENVGRGVPEALRAVGLTNVGYVRKQFSKRFHAGHGSVPDEDWIPFVGRGGWLAFSSDTAILEAEAQRNLLISENVSIVFLTSGQENAVEMLKLVLKRWDWLEAIDRNQSRPFAYLLPISGRKPKLDSRVS